MQAFPFHGIYPVLYAFHRPDGAIDHRSPRCRAGRRLSVDPVRAAALQRLAAGESLADAALALGVGISTVRTHLGHLFTKTGTRRQAELVALVARVQPRS